VTLCAFRRRKEMPRGADRMVFAADHEKRKIVEFKFS